MRSRASASFGAVGILLHFLAAGCVTAPTVEEAQDFVAERAGRAGEESIVFTANSGETVEAYRGSFEVPENRNAEDSRRITISYVRFPATGESPGSPIVYLAGGPGGSGSATARGRRFPLFMAMREFGDVIAYDQRGTGASQTAPRCTSDVIIPSDSELPRAQTIMLLRQAAEQCGAFWRSQGADPAGYTTVENARDLDALRVHLGAETISLWGISYGSHLALAAVKQMGAHIDRLVLASVEGLDQTVKLPARTDDYFDRLQDAVNTQPRAQANWPEISALLRLVHARLAAQPVTLQLTTGAGTSEMLLTKQVMQSVASALIADPNSAGLLLQLYTAVEHKQYDAIAGLLSRFFTPNAPQSFDLMPLAMDIASGIGDGRRMQIEREAKTALLGDMLNFPMPHLAGALGLDLGDRFREPPNASVPTLILSGTLDGRTYPESQREAVSGLGNTTFVTVVNAGHNLFMTSPEVTESIKRFMRGEAIADQQVFTDLPDFTAAPNF